MAEYKLKVNGADIDNVIGTAKSVTGIAKMDGQGRMHPANSADVLQLIINSIYPVGAIFMSTNETDPSTYLLGTTWARWADGRVPVGVSIGADNDFGYVEQTGGAKSVTLSSAQLPAASVQTLLESYSAYIPGQSETPSDTYGTVAYKRDGSSGNLNGTIQGQGQAHNNLQPYITCYMWKRTA